MNFQRLQRTKHTTETALSLIQSRSMIPCAKRTLSNTQTHITSCLSCCKSANKFIRDSLHSLFYFPCPAHFRATVLIKAHSLIARWQEIMETIFIVDFWLFRNLLRNEHTEFTIALAHAFLFIRVRFLSLVSATLDFCRSFSLALSKKKRPTKKTTMAKMPMNRKEHEKGESELEHFRFYSDFH